MNKDDGRTNSVTGQSSARLLHEDRGVSSENATRLDNSVCDGAPTVCVGPDWYRYDIGSPEIHS